MSFKMLRGPQRKGAVGVWESPRLNAKDLMESHLLEQWLFSNPIKQWRFERKYSRTAIAIEISVSVASLYMWERGVTVPSDQHFYQMARLMNVETDQLEVYWRNWLARRPSFLRPEGKDPR